MISFPPFRLETDEERLWKGEKVVALRRKPFAILRYLALNPQKLVTHDELLENVWRGAVVSDSAMRSHLHELRQVLGDGVIETVVGRGYRFVASLGADAPRAPEVTAIDPLVVGRDADIEALRAALERARGGRRQVCFVTGKPGIGKSTLVRAFVASLDATISVGRGYCLEQHGTPEPYLPIIEALGQLARSPRGPQTIAALVRYAPMFVSRVPSLISDEQLAEATRRAAGGNESRMLRELSEAIEAMSSHEPLVLVLEDLQWSDVATIDLLHQLGQRLERAKLLVIATSRHAEIQSTDHPLNHVMRTLVARSGATLLQLAKMTDNFVGDFLDRRFPGHAFPPRLTEVVTKISGGTPLFMVSLADELVARGMFVERDGAWQVTSMEDVEAHRPDSVKQLIDMQIDRMTPAEQRALEAAAIVGAEFSATLVAAALALPVDDVDETLSSLARRALMIHADAVDRYAVNHALVQEVCLERGNPARRQRWHRLVAEELERDPDAHPHQLAQHFDSANDPVRAVPAYLAAARQAAQRYASSDTVALCRRALDLIPRMPAGRDRDQLELQILTTMCGHLQSNVLSAVYAGRDPLAVHARAIEIARSMGDPSNLYVAISQLCVYNLIVSRYDHSTELLAELEEIERAHAISPAVTWQGHIAHGIIAFYRADYPTAQRMFAKLLPPDRAALDGEAAVATAVVLGHVACLSFVLGEADRALAEANETLALANKSKSLVATTFAHALKCRIGFLRRDPIAADQAREAALATTSDMWLHDEARGFAMWTEARQSPLALTAFGPMLEKLRERMAAHATGTTLVGLMVIEALKLSKHTDVARELAAEILAFARAHNERAYLPEFQRA